MAINWDVLDGVQAGSRMLVVTKPSTNKQFGALIDLRNSGVIVIDPAIFRVLQGFVDSSEGNNPGGAISLRAGPNWNAHTFKDATSDLLESVKVSKT